jgi:putative ABC transport system permease protein
MSSVRYLFRRMLRSSGFSVMVVAMIALGLGVNLGVLTISRTILSHSIEVPEANRLVYFTLGSGADTIPNFSGPGYEALRSEGAVKDLLAWKPTFFRVQTRNGTLRSMGALVTGNTFSVLELSPYLGRFFDEKNDVSGGGKDGWVAVLGYDFWKAQMGHDPNVIGQAILVDGQPVRIIGVLPKDFQGISGLSPGVMLPRHFSGADKSRQDDFNYPGNLSWYVFGRLPKGVSIEAVQTNLKTIEQSFRKAADPKDTVFASLLPHALPGNLLGVQDGRYGLTSTLSSIISILIIEVLAGLLLLFCGCNLILLFSGRAKREAQTAAIRMALGARPIHIVRFAILEALVFSVIGYLAGVPLAWGIVRLFAIVVQSFIGLDVFSTVAPTSTFFVVSFVFTAAIGCCTAFCASLWQGRKRTDLTLTLRTGSTATFRQPNWVVGVEIFAALLLITTTLIGWMGFLKLSTLPSGFAASNIVITTLAIDKNKSQAEELNRILDLLRASPGVQSAATISTPPLSGGTANANIKMRNSDGSISERKVWPASVSLQYFSAIGTRIIQGRSFIREDLAGGPVCVVSHAALSALGLGKDPIGAYLYQDRGSGKNATLVLYCRVIGVAEDAHFSSMADPADAVVYFLTRDPQPTLVVRASSTALAAESIRNVVRSIDPASLVTEIEPITSVVNRDLRIRKVITFAGVFCTGMAVLILGIGVFGLLSLRVVERKRDIGIQIALGARPLDVCLSVVRNLQRSVLVSVTFGSALGLLVAKVIANSYELSMRPVINGYMTGLILLAILMLAAAAIPITRALRTSPIECLSSE